MLFFAALREKNNFTPRRQDAKGANAFLCGFAALREKIISRQDARTQKGYVVYAPVSGISTNSSPNR
jgi:hypothetical protein